MNINIKSEDLNVKINNELLPYALALPVHNFTHPDAIKIYNSLLDPARNIEKIINDIERIVMHPYGRALWLENRISLIPAFKDICPVVDYAYLAYGRGNHAAAYFTLLPIAEGIILRWMGYFHPSNKDNEKPPFKKIKEEIRKIKNNKELLNSHTFVSIWIDALVNILCDEFFQHTSNGYSLEYFNRHAGCHLLELLNLSNIKGLVMRIFIILELLVETYVVENKYKIENIIIPLSLNENKSENINKRFHAYKISYDWINKDLNEHPEAILRDLYD